jgi:hypothetical protein
MHKHSHTDTQQCKWFRTKNIIFIYHDGLGCHTRVGLTLCALKTDGGGHKTL